MGSSVSDVDCRYCLEEEVFMDVKEEPTLYKVGAECKGCGHDYGVIDRIPQSDISHTDDLFEQAEEFVRNLLE